jgi:sarcosine oxidase
VRSEFAVVGAGICGLSAGWALARRGHEVTVVDQAPVGNAWGGSHGSCRVFRLGYEQPAYVSLARRAREAWSALEEASGEQLLIPTPQLTLGPQMDQVRAAMEIAGAPHQLFSAHEATERFPGVAVSDPVLYEPDSAVIAADRALAALAGLGAVLAEPTKVTEIAERGPGVRVSTANGDIDADRVIVCAGPWTSHLMAGAGIAVPGWASMEQVAYLTRAEADQRGSGTTPIFISYGSEIPYGLPVPGSDRYKVGIHFGGPPADPDRQDHAEDAGLSERIERAARRFLPGFDPRPVAVERCIYDNSPDDDFIIDRVGDIVIGSGTSGHGFKFGPLIGEWLANLATGDVRGADGAPSGESVPSWFALSRFANRLQSGYG